MHSFSFLRDKIQGCDNDIDMQIRGYNLPQQSSEVKAQRFLQSGDMNV